MLQIKAITIDIDSNILIKYMRLREFLTDQLACREVTVTTGGRVTFLCSSRQVIDYDMPVAELKDRIQCWGKHHPEWSIVYREAHWFKETMCRLIRTTSKVALDISKAMAPVVT